ncbi:MAG: glucose sorbosone dehydrogenase [Candidatus Brocadia sp. WS118]|nr:MAG: glucose sorbosone dehydrogenase [Candidatus Brocadia sp. WS118]
MKFWYLSVNLFLLFFVSCVVGAQQIQQYKLQEAFPHLSFDSPVDLQHAGDGTNRLFVVSQRGMVSVFENNPLAKSAQTFLDIRDRVIAAGELGLLGLAFHPDYEQNGYFYVNYTAANPLRSIIARYSVSEADPNAADNKSELILFHIRQPFPNHNGGQLAFGPDGYLYIALGDGGSAGDPQNNGQNRSSFLGKILRIDVNATSGETFYGIPPDNPFAGNTKGFKEEIYAYGLRNPWRFSFDFATGWLWAGDVGQNSWEEIDIITKGENYGWRVMEGNHCYNPSPCNTTGLALPVWEYGHDNPGGCSITGGHVYRGKKLPELAGRYLYGDYCSGRIWALRYDGGNSVTNTLLLKEDVNISSFGIDEDHEIFICDLNGKIYELSTVTSSPTATPTPIIKGKIFGYVMDNKGNFIKSARIKLKGKETRKKTLSDTAGFFEFTGIEGATYKVIAEKTGYKKTRQMITMNDGEEKEIMLEMKKTVDGKVNLLLNKEVFWQGGA